ncbi:MAG: UDP-N-acetylglucosamine 2-epimerase (hydrolyzing) [Candidatus Omnitrophica bacterium]|nr:UDP-N-acetylglucosamine 2-epimerase (hydrolyzing) [Candidatus Omnitrophota bacterium]
MKNNLSVSLKKTKKTVGKRKICVVVHSRANYGRIKSVLKSIQAHPDLELQLVVGASAILYRFGNVIDIIRKDGFEPNATVYIVIEGENPTTMAKSTGLGIIELATIFENLKPDIVLTVADRYETLATAVASSYMNIPLAHTQGGEVTGSIDESVRHAITKLAHIHFPTTALSRQRLIKMGEDPKSIYQVGCPAMDILTTVNLKEISRLTRYGGTGCRIDFSKPYMVVLQHPVTTEYGQGFDQIQATLSAVEQVGMQTVWLWPNVDAGSDDISKGLRIYREQHGNKQIHFYRNFSVEDYAILINNCACLIGNSSSAIREGAFLGVPSVNIGTRQAGRERGRNILDVGYNAGEIAQAIKKQLKHGKYLKDALYGDGKAGKKIVDILAKCPLSIQKKMMY